MSRRCSTRCGWAPSRRGLAGAVRHSARLGRVAHQHAGARLRAHAGAGDLHHAALHRRGRLDPAGRAQCRLAQPLLHVRSPAREAGPFNIYSFTGLVVRHRALLLSLHLHLHHGGARPGVVGDGGRRQHPGRGHVADHAAGHAAAGAAGDPGRPDHLLPRGHRAVRVARHDRHPGALQRGDDPALPVLRQSRAGRGGGRLCHAAALRHRDADPGAAPDDPSQGLRRRSPARAASGGRSQLGPLALGDVRLRHVRGDALGLPAAISSCCRPPSPRPGAAASRSTISRSGISTSSCSSMRRRPSRWSTPSCSPAPPPPPA